MNVKININKDFERFFDTLIDNYGEDFAELNGLSEEKLSFTDYINNFSAKKTVADVSIDGSSNVKNKDIVTLRSEMGKPHEKLIAYNKIFLEMKQHFGLRKAKKWLELEWNKALYLHDANTSTFVPYCFAYDITKLAEEGLFYLDEHDKPEPAQHLETFVDFVKEFINFTSNRTSGACGLPNLIPYLYYYWYKDVKSDHYPRCQDEETFAKSEIQRIIYGMNQPYTRDGIQSAFVNTSIFDGEYFDALFGGAVFPNGEFMIDHKEGILKFEKWFLEEMATIKDRGRMFTYPVNSISLLKKDGKFVDEDFARWCSNHNRRWNDSNIFADKDVTSLSNCPLSGDTKILYWSDFYQEYKLSPIKEVYFNKAKDEKNTIKVLSNGKEVKCKINQFDIPIQYEIELVNGASIKTTANHLNKIYGKDFTPTRDLTTNDYLPYSLHSFNNNDIMSYEDGKIVGMFLGDGSYKGNAEIVLSLNKETDRDDIDFVYEYCTKQFGAKITTSRCISQISNKDKCVNININSPYLRGLVEQFVIGNSALSKKLSYRCLNCSLDFRKGILDGLYTTDGGNSNRIYTSSSDLKDSIVVLLASMGMVSNVTTDNREGRLGQNVNYVIRYYTPNNRKILKDVYIIDEDYMWIKIKSIKKIKPSAKSYCLEVLEDVEPIFMLGNGIVTHNCRLKSNIKDLGYFNSIGGTALKVGSIKVSTINLTRISYEAKGKEKKFLEILKDRLIINMEMLHCIRHIIKRNVEKNLLPNFQEGIIDFEHLYNTVGINGIYETMKTFGYTEVDEFGCTKYTEQAMEFGKAIFDLIHKTIQEFASDKDYMINVEQIPAETAAVRFLQADKMLYPDETVLVTHTKTAYRFVVDGTTYLVPPNTQLKLVNDNNNVVTIEDFLYDTENTYEIDDTCLKEFIVIESCENK